MTLPDALTHPAVTHGVLLVVGYVAGRRAFRRKLQTTEGRRRAGWDTAAARPALRLVVDDEPDTTPIRAHAR